MSEIITISKNANLKALALTFYGAFLVLLLLALFIPFFRHILTFTSVITAGFAISACIFAYKDKEAGIKKTRPANFYVPPKWFKPTFYLSMILGTAGLRLGFYIVPILWIITWIFMSSMATHVRACYEMKDKNDTWAPKDGLDPCHPDYGKEAISVKS